MPVTQLAIFRLPSDLSLSSPEFRSVLREAKQIPETYSNNLAKTISYHPSDNPTHIATSDLPKPPDDSLPHPFFYYCQHEDPTLLYLIGSWPSAALHQQSFRPSPEGAKLREVLMDAGVKLESAIYVELDESALPVDAPVLVIRQHIVTPMNNAGFEEAFEENKHHLEHFSMRKLAGGWKHKDDDLGKDVFVLFSGWDDVDHHSKFEKSEQAAEYAKIVEWIDEGGLEVRHAVRVDLTE